MTILKYLRTNIKKINDMGVKVRIEKIDIADDKTGNALKNQGIPRLPALMLPNGKPLIGLKQVMDLFERNLRGQRPTRSRPQADTSGADTDISDWLMREITSGVDKKGKVKDDDEDDDAADIQRKMADYNRRAPKHRRGDADERSPSPERGNTRGRSTRRQRAREPESDDDNIASPSPERRPARRGRVSNDGDVDAQMLEAWLDNNTPTE